MLVYIKIRQVILYTHTYIHILGKQHIHANINTNKFDKKFLGVENLFENGLKW